MLQISAKKYDFSLITYSSKHYVKSFYPYFRDLKGDQTMWLVSPQHGRSYVVDKRIGRWIVSKGNGLSYTNCSLLKTREQDNDTWGILNLKDAKRDFRMGMEVASLGIKTNLMESIIELEKEIYINDNSFFKPILLQYSVECPYRISDAPFMTTAQIKKYSLNWNKLDKWGCDKGYKIAAQTLVSNLRILHENQVLHNALTSQNITWALELVDFELASSPKYPYENEDYQKRVQDLFDREILHIYQIILDIAWILKENPDYEYLDSLLKCYGFNLTNDFKTYD